MIADTLAANVRFRSASVPPRMADATPQPGTSSTPGAAPNAAAPDAPTTTTTTTADPAKPNGAAPADTATKPADKPADTPADKSTAAPDKGKDTDPSAKPADKPTDDKAAPLFKPPEGVTLAPEAATAFEAAIKPHLVDGKVTLTPQQVADMFFAQAKSASDRWQASLTKQDQAWAAESRARFSKAQMDASEVGIGWLRSMDPQAVEVMKGIINHPSIRNALRAIGESLSEDSFELGDTRPTRTQRSAKDIMYPKQ